MYQLILYSSINIDTNTVLWWRIQALASFKEYLTKRRGITMPNCYTCQPKYCIHQPMSLFCIPENPIQRYKECGVLSRSSREWSRDDANLGYTIAIGITRTFSCWCQGG